MSANLSDEDLITIYSDAVAGDVPADLVPLANDGQRMRARAIAGHRAVALAAVQRWVERSAPPPVIVVEDKGGFLAKALAERDALRRQLEDTVTVNAEAVRRALAMAATQRQRADLAEAQAKEWRENSRQLEAARAAREADAIREGDRADAAEKERDQYRDATTWEVTCLSCAGLLTKLRAQEERAETAEGVVRDLVGALAECDGSDAESCGAPATTSLRPYSYCDAHAPENGSEYDIAGPLRRALALLSGRAPKGGVP